MEPIIACSKITPLTRKKLLFKGTSIAFLGACLIVLSSQIPLQQLRLYGLPLFIFSLWIIKQGLCPYKIAEKKALVCDQLVLEKQVLYYIVNNRTLCSIPKKEILSINFFENAKHYGVVIHLTNNSVKILDHPFYPKRLLRKLNRNKKLFFPFFQKETAEKLNQGLQSS